MWVYIAMKIKMIPISVTSLLISMNKVSTVPSSALMSLVILACLLSLQLQELYSRSSCEV